MAVPKRKTSKMKMRTRRQTQKAVVNTTSVCSECGSPHLSHQVCPSCGYYRGRQVITIKAE